MLRLRGRIKQWYHYIPGFNCSWLFWYDSWLNGVSLSDLLPKHLIMMTGIMKDTKLRDVFVDDRWRLPVTVDEDIKRI